MVINSKSGLNPANMMTLLRLLSIPVLLWLLFKGKTVFFLYVLVFSGVTDFLDGFCARKAGCVTDFGKKFDPIADKILISSVMFGLYFFCRVDNVSLIPLFVPILVFVRDILIVMGYMIVAKLEREIELRPSKIGKITTFFQFIFIFGLFFVGGWIKQYLIGVMVILTIGSGLDYLVRVIKPFFKHKNSGRILL